MMTSLFSVFDPTSSSNIPSWISSCLFLLLFPFKFWFVNSRPNMIFSLIFKTLHKEFKTLMIHMYPMGSSMVFCSLFVLILFNNFLGLFPYIFTSTSHMLMTLSLAIPLWLSFIVFGIMNNVLHMLAHLVPQGTPPLLMAFMVCIETISNIIRPLTLSIRLAANMIAGHLLLTLLGSQGPNVSLIILSSLIFSQIMLLVLESAVAIIQSYVFTILSVLYSSEVN
uniref:ATP synthase subunit a n=1 Tax=Scutigerella causeyae TaxID=388540 RepID=Q06RG2_9MYRI|nr:ATP synthase F0 subunit 6 [Scutigerella causeyae]ABF93305.1 ATP synthase F0 subunit 6 [Scutigerella causeyae]